MPFIIKPVTHPLLCFVTRLLRQRHEASLLHQISFCIGVPNAYNPIRFFCMAIFFFNAIDFERLLSCMRSQ